MRTRPARRLPLLGVVPLAVFLFKTYPKLKADKIADGESVWDRLGVKL